MDELSAEVDELDNVGVGPDTGGDELGTGEDELKVISQLPNTGWHPVPQYVELSPLHTMG